MYAEAHPSDLYRDVDPELRQVELKKAQEQGETSKAGVFATGDVEFEIAARTSLLERYQTVVPPGPDPDTLNKWIADTKNYFPKGEYF